MCQDVVDIVSACQIAVIVVVGREKNSHIFTKFTLLLFLLFFLFFFLLQRP